MKKLLPIALVLVLSLLAAAPAARADDEAEKKKGEVTALLKSGTDKYQKGEYEAAQADMAKALELDPKNVYAHNMLGIIKHRYIGDLDGALEHYRFVIENSADRQQKAFAHTMRGTIIFTNPEKRSAKDAIAEFNKALEAWPTSTTFVIASNAFHFIRDQGKSFDDEALKAIDRAFEFAEKEAKAAGKEVDRFYHAKMCVQKAVCLVSKDRKDEAAKLLEGLEFDDQSYYNLAQYYALIDQKDEATEYITKAFEGRATPKARNQLREFVRRDHDFDKLRGEYAWRKLLEPERED